MLCTPWEISPICDSIKNNVGRDILRFYLSGFLKFTQITSCFHIFMFSQDFCRFSHAVLGFLIVSHVFIFVFFNA